MSMQLEVPLPGPGFRRYAVVDTETANHFRHSLCSLAVLSFDGRRETDRLVTLVDPETPYWTNSGIHGIASRDVVGAPSFKDLAGQIANVLSSVEVVFAHSSPFDESVLREAASLARVRLPEVRWACTCRLARKTFPELPNHRLPTVAAHVGFELRHHDAESDAEACAAIVHALHSFPEARKQRSSGRGRTSTTRNPARAGRVGRRARA